MILSAEQARAVVGERCDGWFCCPGRPHKHGCVQPENDPVALFIPAATADTWPVGEWIEVGSPCLCAPEDHWDCQGTGMDNGPVGRVRLGEPVPVIDPDEADTHEASYYGPECVVVAVNPRSPLGRHMEHQPAWDGALEWDDCADITHPHLDLWPDAWQPGSWAYPITERSTA